jgi:hypothetical protein
MRDPFRGYDAWKLSDDSRDDFQDCEEEFILDDEDPAWEGGFSDERHGVATTSAPREADYRREVGL